MGKMSQRKGAEGERELAQILNECGYAVQRGGSQTYGTVPDLTSLKGVHVEVKRCEQLNLHAAVRQSENDAARFRDGLPAVFHRKNRTQWLVSMPLSAWLKLYERGMNL